MRVIDKEKESGEILADAAKLSADLRAKSRSGRSSVCGTRS